MVDHDELVHHACAMYLTYVMGFLENEHGDRFSWDSESEAHPGISFDEWNEQDPVSAQMRITRADLDNLRLIRNKVIHNGGILPRGERDRIRESNIPQVEVREGGEVRLLGKEFLNFTRLACYNVCQYHGQK